MVGVGGAARSGRFGQICRGRARRARAHCARRRARRRRCGRAAPPAPRSGGDIGEVTGEMTGGAGGMRGTSSARSGGDQGRCAQIWTSHRWRDDARSSEIQRDQSRSSEIRRGQGRSGEISGRVAWSEISRWPSSRVRLGLGLGLGLGVSCVQSQITNMNEASIVLCDTRSKE